MSTSTKKTAVEIASHDLEIATKAAEAARAALRDAQDAHDALPLSAAADARDAARQALAAAKEAHVWADGDKKAAERRLAAAKTAEAEKTRTRELAAARVKYENALGTLAGDKDVVAKHAAAIILAEQALADAIAAAHAEIASLNALRAETVAAASRLAIDATLPPAVTFGRIRAAIAVEERAPTPFVVADLGAAARIAPHVILPRAPQSPIHERARFVVEMVGEHMVAGEEMEALFPLADRIEAALDGTYAAKSKAATEQIKATRAQQRAEAEARLRAKEREVWEREQKAHLPLR